MLADCLTEVELGQAFVDRCIEALVAGELTPEEAAMAKMWCTEMQGRVADRCLQLHGGYGYMVEYPIARAYADARVTRIYGGANEIMRELIGRGMGLRALEGGRPAGGAGLRGGGVLLYVRTAVWGSRLSCAALRGQFWGRSVNMG